MNYINSLIVLNDIVNQKEKLLQELKEFTNKLFVSGRRMNDDDLGWYISIKSSKQIDINKLQCIYDEIISSHKLIEPIIINIDKQNEIYQILMNKDELITRSINILISMYIPGSKNYNNLNVEQLNQNDTHIKALIPIVEAKMTSMLRPQDKTKSRQNYSHSYESNSSYQLINDILNQKEKLLQELKEFTNSLFVSGRKMNDDKGEWYILIKSLNKIDEKKLKSIYDEIISSDNLIKLIINIDKQNEIYQILMNKNELITRSIHILKSMYIQGSNNYNNLTQKQLNQNDIHINILNQIVEAKMASVLRPQDKTKSMQKYSHSYQLPSSRNIVEDKMASVLRPQDKTKSQSKYSHSYNSKSSNSILLANFVTNNNKSELLLINAIGDGDCFINAIFDYGLYTGNLLHIYDRLINFELLIENLPKYENSIKKAKSFFGGAPILKKLTSKEYTKILDNELIKEDDKETMYLKKTYKIPEEQLFTCFHHPFPDDRVRLSEEYEIERKKFIKFMKYIQVLYVFTYGYNIMIKKLTNIFSIAKNAELLESFDFDTNFINYIKIKYYNKKGNLKPIDIRAFLDDYMNFYARTEGYYTGGDQILIFKKIFFKKLKLRDSRESIPCFFLNYEFEKNIRLSTKEIKFMKILKESVEVDNDKKFISLIRHGEHYKLLVYREQSIITY